MFNEILNGRFSDGLARFFGMQTGRPVAPTLAPEIGASFNIPTGVEDDAIFDRRRFVAHNLIAANVGSQSWVKVTNPAASGLLVVVERWMLHNTGGASESYFWFRCSVLGGGVGGAAAMQYADTRYSPQPAAVPVPAVQFTSDNAGTSLGTTTNPFYRIWSIAANGRYEAVMPFILAPGTAVVVRTNNTNVPIDCSIQGYVRRMTAQEAVTA